MRIKNYIRLHSLKAGVEAVPLHPQYNKGISRLSPSLSSDSCVCIYFSSKFGLVPYTCQ